MEVKDRLIEFIKSKGLNNKKFEEKVGLGNGFVSKVGTTIRISKLELISKAFPDLNQDWLTKGIGNMLLTEKSSPYPHASNEVSLLSPSSDQIIYVPLVNQYAYAGYICGYDDTSYMETLPTIPFLVDYEGRGNYIAFEVKGDSMNDGTEDSYLEGDRLLCREIQPHLWASYKLHIRKWDFVIVHQEGILIKRIIDHDVENHTITIHSLNEYYEDRVIDLREVKQIFNVIESIRPRRR